MSKSEKRAIPQTDRPRKRLAKSSDVSISLNELYFKDDVIEKFTNAFKEKTPINLDNGAFYSTAPFPHCGFPNFINNHRDFLDRLKNEVTDLNFYAKDNDLFKFSQSDDLKTINTPYIRATKKLLYETFLGWLQKVTGISLNSTVDMTAARYEYTDTLLCHDDELEGRRIAYIYYLVTPWKESDGGTLDLFDTDATGQPDKVVKSLVPEHNKLVFFEVSPTSFHQVREVLNEDKVRLSISGWFHGPHLPANPIPPELPVLYHGPCHVEQQLVMDWINPVYLNPDTQLQVQMEFLNTLQVELIDFLKKDKYMALVEELAALDSWKVLGPPNRRRYRKAENLPPLAQQLNKLLTSEAMFLILSNLTAMALHHLAADDTHDGECTTQLCRWSQGDYTLVWDNDPEAAQSTLDATLFLDFDYWCEDYGGVVVFVGPSDMDDQHVVSEYLSVHPRSNSLALVFRNLGTNRFIKHLNHRTGNHHYHTLHALYRQRLLAASPTAVSQ